VSDCSGWFSQLLLAAERLERQEGDDGQKVSACFWWKKEKRQERGGLLMFCLLRDSPRGGKAAT
jgi:hypothetical protein